jgi:5-methyltetrahydropteroyltriglutamate--homocysteine methyltransferase
MSMVHYRGGRQWTGPSTRTWTVLADLSATRRRDPRSATSAAVTCGSTTRAWPLRPRAAGHQPPARTRAPAPALPRADQRGAGEQAGGHARDHHVPSNCRSSWAAEGGYDFVAGALFRDWPSTGSSASRRRAVREPRRCGSCRLASRWCGLVTTKRIELEDADVLKGGSTGRRCVPLTSCASPRWVPPPWRQTPRPTTSDRSWSDHPGGRRGVGLSLPTRPSDENEET